MKRTKAITEIKWAGWHGDSVKAATIAARYDIGTAAARKAYSDGGKMKGRGEPCGCDACDKRNNNA